LQQRVGVTCLEDPTTKRRLRQRNC